MEMTQLPSTALPFFPTTTTNQRRSSQNITADLPLELIISEHDSDIDFELRCGDIEEQGLFGVSRKSRASRWKRTIQRVLYSISHWILVLLKEIVPSFLQHYLQSQRSTADHSNTSARTARSSSPLNLGTGNKLHSLDGIRGVACLIVFNFHFLYPYTRTITHGYLADNNAAGIDNHSHSDLRNLFIHQLPLLCLLHRGRAAVCVFFAVSGYVLSHRFLQLVRTGTLPATAQAHKTLSSLTLRRSLRLYLPPTITMAATMLTAWLGVFEAGSRLYGSAWTVEGEWEPHPNHRASLYETLSVFAKIWWDWSTPWTWDARYIEYDPHLWTIPIEFRCSIVLFLVLLATAHLRVLCRTVLIGGGTVYCLIDGRWDVAVFLGGAVVAEIHLVLSSASLATESESESCEHHYRDLPTSSDVSPPPLTSVTTMSLAPRTPANSPQPYLHHPAPSYNLPLSSISCQEHQNRTDPSQSEPHFSYWTPWIFTSFLVSLYLLSFPDSRPDSTPGFTTLATSLTPEAFSSNGGHYHFWHALGSILFILSIQLLPYLASALFENNVAQYLGRISYGLYLCHGPIQHSLGFAVQPWIWTHVAGVYPVAEDGSVRWQGAGAGGSARWCLGLAVGWAVNLTVTLVVADLFWRRVDMGCVRFARTIEEVMKLNPPRAEEVLDAAGTGLPECRGVPG